MQGIPRCRACGRTSQLERAHVMPRERDRRISPRRAQVARHSVVWLCGPTPGGCHGAYDAHELDLYPHLTDEELRCAVALAGGPGHALRRLSGPLWRSSTTKDVRTIDERLRALMSL